MQNKGTDYIRRILRDKARLKRWRQIMLCLSCVVVFCTVYVLILPAITLEKKTTCEEEEQIAIQEEQTPIQEANENTVQSTIPSDDSEDIDFVLCEPIEEESNDVDNVEITEDPEEEMDVDFASGEEDAIAAADENVMPEGGIADGFDLSAPENSSRLKDVTLLYKLPGNENWQEFSKTDNNTVIPANAKIKLQVEYKDIQIQNLIDNYNCELTYNLPEVMRNITPEGGIFDGNNKVGTVTCKNRKITVTFNSNYLSSQKKDNQSTINGNFYAQGDVKLSQLPQEDGKITVSVANKNYYLNFGQDAVAKYGQINIEKTCDNSQVIATESGNYLAYTITVTAGEDGCPDVSVVDTIVSNSDRVESYAEISATAETLAAIPNGQKPYEMIAEGKTHGTVYLGNPDSTNPVPTPGAENITTAPGSMVWKIGDMAAGESRTLTYYVKLKDNVGLHGKEINNKADVYSKTYARAYHQTSFTPKIDYDMSKSQDGNIVRNSDGTYTIKYRLNFTLKKDTSNYALKNFEFRDLLDAWDIRTDPKALPYISYNRNSVELYVKTDEASDYTALSSETDYTVSWAKGDDNYVTPWHDSNGNPTRFKITGANGKPITVKPGDSYYVTYSVTVKPEALAVMKANNIDVKNRYYVYASNAKSDSGDAIDQVWHGANVGNYKWDEKIVETGTAADQTIEMETGDRYDLTSGTVKLDSSSDTSFTVPAGSYPYTVDVNQTLGEWNATNVLMKDELTPKDKMTYIGYAKVEACEYDADTKAYDVKETKWVKIDGLSSFALKPSELGWKDANYAYKFTYYATPANANFSSAKVNNKFSLSGQVGKDGKLFDISDIYSQKEITISGSYKMNVKKESWYYEEPKTGAATWQNGKLYWVIEVSGTEILQGTYFRDSISKDSGLTDSYLHSDSLAGIYMGTLPNDKTIIGYSSLEEIQKTGKLTDVTGKFSTKLTNDKSFTGTDNYSELSLQAKESITLGTVKLYFIVRTEPQSLPTKYRDAFTYRNHISTSDDGKTWIDHGKADKLLCGGADILKELGQTFTYDGTTVTSKNDGADQGQNSRIVTTELPGAGQYAAWAFKVNYAGELSGTYRVLETIPDGMELAYIRIKWVGGGQDFGAISSKENPGLETSGWTKERISAATDNGGQFKTTTYYVKGKQALIELGDFKAGKKRDDYSVDVQVVCRVTDPDVLLGGETKTFTNEVTLQTTNGQDISTATSPAEITPKKIEKTFTTTNPQSEKINFTIEANQFGAALSTKDGTTLTLIDKLSSTLILDTETIRVINSKTKAPVTDYTALLDADNTLKIVIPRNVPVTITYTAAVNAPPGQAVSFSNEAYWENYSSAGGDSVEENNYSYAAGGTVGAGNNIKLKIIKKDQNNLSSTLQGAEFEIVSCTRNDDGTIDVSGEKWTGITRENGVIFFGAGSSTDSAMNYNTIYKVTETKAPDGYVINSEPIYIMVPRKEENATDYSEYVNNCIKDSRIHIQYQSIYELTVLNHKGEITVEKKFKDAGGNDANPVSGTYKFGLYENADGTISGTTATPLQTVTITYNAAETGSKTAKFTNLELSKTYYVYELDDNGNPIKDSTKVAVVNKMEYLTSYATTNTDGTTGVNSAVNGNTVTVTNQTRVKELPSTGSYGPLIFRLAGAVLIFFAGLQMLINIKKRACNNR